MVASAVFVMDSKGKIIISRNYRGDVPSSASIRYVASVRSSHEKSTFRRDVSVFFSLSYPLFEYSIDHILLF